LKILPKGMFFAIKEGLPNIVFMEAILLPTDFSPTAKNAAVYAIKLANQLGVKKLVLYHSYEIPLTIDPMVPAMQMLEIESLKEASQKNITDFKEELTALAPGIDIETLSEYGDLTEGLDEICEQLNAGLVVMGITGGGVLEEKLIGSNTLSVAKHTTAPVIIVPADAGFTPIERIMLTGDFDKKDTTIPLNPVRNILAVTGAKLFVFNVEEKPDNPDISYTAHQQLAEFDPEYHFSQNKNYVEAINTFALEYKADLLITILKKHGFFEGMFSADHTKMLAFHSHVPIMVVQAR